MPQKHGALIRFFCLSFCATLLATHARAQAPIETAVAHVGVGAGINFYDPTNSNGKTSNGLEVAYRWHSFHSGWGPTFGLDWHTNDFTEPLGSANMPLGSLRMRALLAGYGHTRHFKRLTASGSVSVGYSFNNFTVDGSARPAFARTGVALTDVRVHDSAMLKPDVAVWYEHRQAYRRGDLGGLSGGPT